MTEQLTVLLESSVAKLNAGDLEGAEIELTKALHTSPGDPVTLYLLGVARFDAHRWADAEGFLRRAISAKPKQPMVYLYLAQTLRALQRPSEAVAVCRTALAIAPDHGPALLELAKAQEESGDEANAEITYRRILRCDLEPMAALSLSAMLNRAGRSEEAEKIIRDALAGNSDHG